MTKGRELPPLLPLEYCRIDRAARMLECEVEDIIHWGSIGAIRLCCHIDGIPFFLHGDLTCPENYGKRIDGAMSYSIQFVNHAYFYTHTLNGRPSPTLGNAHGLWPLSIWGMKEIEQKGGISASQVEFYAKNDEGVEAMVTPAISGPDYETVITKGDLWVTQTELVKLHHSITNGEPLPNIYNNAELAQRAKEQEAMTQLIAEPRATAKQSDMITSLIDLHFTEKGQRLDDMGHQAFFNNVLAPALAAAKIACPVTERAFDDWMQKARKFSK
ncbi:hypothetical protein [Zobellella maritima]|uniref:hypothetical protein n=1 Tax=Zobellella maritima TaxID=2059725 RepID=UPI000E300A3F|nr:hypothetical protein [Zobellella maritima]